MLIALALFSTSMVLRAVSWHDIVRAALPDRPVKRRTILSGTVIGVLMSATLPARLGEPSRALIVARRLGRMRETLPVLVGTLVSQTLLNLLALLLLGVLVLGSSDVLQGPRGARSARQHGARSARRGRADRAVADQLERPPRRLAQSAIGRLVARGRRRDAAAAQWADGLPQRRAGPLWATSAQLAAWGLQLLGAYALLLALNLDSRAGLGAAAAVLFAVNVTAVLPATPSNVGVFQLAV